MIDKKLLESMLESNMRGELAGSMDSMEMREILQKGIELFEENERLRNTGGLIRELRKANQENEQLQQWVNDLQSGMYINCVYCGHRYGPESETPVSMADVLKEHIEKCPKHPMSKLKQENERFRREIEGLQEIRHDIANLNEFMSTKIAKAEYAGKPCVDTAITEIQQLQSQVARAMKILSEIDSFIEREAISFQIVSFRKGFRMQVWDEIKEIVSRKSNSGYHNPADVAEIQQLQAKYSRARGIAFNIANKARTGKQL
jgi:uncharacterized protein YdcH (DUF465 family)